MEPQHREAAAARAERPSSTLDLDFAEFSDPGRIRGHNEDFWGHAAPHAPDRGWLFAVADGVGGQDLGEVASRTAVETLLAGYLAAASGEQNLALLPRLVQA